MEEQAVKLIPNKSKTNLIDGLTILILPVEI
jgi:hypothetical protein